MSVSEAPGPELFFRIAMKTQRKHLGISQRSLTAQLSSHGITLDSSAITRMELGQRVIRLNEAVAIATILNFPITTGSDLGLVNIAADLISDTAEQLSDLARALAQTAE